jgi:hypothetical protein
MTTQEMDIAKRTSRSNGASAINKDGTIRAVVPLWVEKNVDKSKSVLDFGAGRYCTSTKYLRQKGFDNVTPYDLWCGDGDELLDDQALDRSYDVVFASNVLNVSSSMSMLFETLYSMYNAVNNGGVVICNYPTSPRKMDLSATDIENVIQSVFKSEINIVGGTKSSPIWTIRKEHQDGKS